ncbi:MAG: hypothetical protein GX883_00310 [Firmicutes bacterium]|nr:hypothetical protein [Bacillota bacterium]
MSTENIANIKQEPAGFREPVDGDEDLLTALRNIHQNTVKFGIHLIVQVTPGAATIARGKADSGLIDTALALDHRRQS